MNKYLTLLALLACATVVDAATCAGANTDGTAQACYCALGYWGEVNVGATTNTCQQCTGNTTTDAPGAANTGSATSVSACLKCVAGYFMTATAVVGATGPPVVNAAAATCSSCNTSSAGSTNDGATAVTNAVGCNKCSAGYFMATAATGSSASVCTSCTTSSAGSTNDGATATGTAVQCNKCAANNYMTALATGTTAAQCTACPDKSTSAAQVVVGSIATCVCKDPQAANLSATQATCTCKTGYTGSATTASPCISDTGSSSNSVILAFVSALLSLVLLI